VSINPGAMAFTRIPAATTSWDSDFVIAMIAPFAAE
jgi:hypothetical protein